MQMVNKPWTKQRSQQSNPRKKSTTPRKWTAGTWTCSPKKEKETTSTQTMNFFWRSSLSVDSGGVYSKFFILTGGDLFLGLWYWRSKFVGYGQLLRSQGMMGRFASMTEFFFGGKLCFGLCGCCIFHIPHVLKRSTFEVVIIPIWFGRYSNEDRNCMIWR